ncbi:MAG: serine protease [Bacteroidetes bacterium]|nr:MAG: serine protease [Bacteroidota bacterium]
MEANAKKADDAAGQVQPMLPDEFLTLENEKATKGLPKEFESLHENRIYIHTPHGKPAQITEPKNHADAMELLLPPGANIGLPGLKSGRISRDEIKKAIKPAAHLEGFRPNWIDYAPHPKLAPLAKRYLKRRTGEIVDPHYGVFGTDDRQVYYPSGYPWTCIGKIYAWNDFSKSSPQWSGSGVLIGGRVVLTAGHVAPWGSGNWAMKFIPAFYDGASALGAGVYSYVSDFYGYNDPVSAYDMVVCRLYTPLGNSLGYFGAKTYDSGWQGGNYWSLAGYPGAIANANRPSRQMWWAIDDDDSDGSTDELEFTADSTPGDSGGPVFGFWNGESWPSVVGTDSGGLKETFLWWTIEDTNVAAGGSAMVDLIIWARNNWQ